MLDEADDRPAPRDNAGLVPLQHLRDLGNTLVLVEHDREVIEAADHLVDPGPARGAGARSPPGTTAERSGSKKSLTGQEHRARRDPIPHNRPTTTIPDIVIEGYAQHNLSGSTCLPKGVHRRLRVSEVGQEVAQRGHPLGEGPAASRLNMQAIDPGSARRSTAWRSEGQGHQLDQAPLGEHPHPRRAPGTYCGPRPDPRALRQG